MYNGKRVSDPLNSLLVQCNSEFDLANKLTDEFTNNFNFDNDIDLLPMMTDDWNISFSPFQVCQKLTKLKTDKAMGPDNISSKLLKLGAHLISVPLCKIYNKSIEQRRFPSLFKFAHVTPVPKTSKPSVKDFRPISILPTLSKIFEQLVLECMKDALVACYSPTQHAYRPCGSTTSAVAHIHDTVTKLLDFKETQMVRVLCIDLSKAFDSLQFNRLANHLFNKGLSGSFIE